MTALLICNIKMRDVECLALMKQVLYGSIFFVIHCRIDGFADLQVTIMHQKVHLYAHKGRVVENCG